MVDNISKKSFIDKCSPVLYCDRSMALQRAKDPSFDQYVYIVYLDKEENDYPQVKFIAVRGGEEYLAMDQFFENLMDEDPQCIAIHDTYSGYEQLNNETYAMPMTYKNLKFLEQLPGSARLHEELEHFKREYMQALIEFTTENKGLVRQENGLRYTGLSPEERNQRSKEIKATRASLIESKFTLSQYAQLQRAHACSIEYFRENDLPTKDPFYKLEKQNSEELLRVQRLISQDRQALFFVNDNCEFVVNDVLLTAISESDYEDRLVSSILEIASAMEKYVEIRNAMPARLAQKLAAEQAKEEACTQIISSQQIPLFAVAKNRRGLGTIFSGYHTNYYQCKNSLYTGLTFSDSFKEKIKQDPNLSTLPYSTPVQDVLIKQLNSSGRWNPYVDKDKLIQPFDPTHLGWQSELHYQPIDEEQRGLLARLGYNFEGDVDQVLCLPYPTYVLHVFQHNIEKLMVEHIDVTEVVKQAESYIDSSLKQDNIHAIPENLIHLLASHLAPEKINHYQQINAQYYQNTVLPILQAESLYWMQQELIRISYVPHLMRTTLNTYVFNSDTKTFDALRLSTEDTVLCDAILSLDDPLQFHTDWIAEQVQSVQAKLQQ